VTESEGGIQVHLQDSDRVVDLEQLLDRLDDVYSSCDTDTSDTVTYCRGDAVAVCVATIWQRATVLSDGVSESRTVGVQCIDTGSIHDVDVGKVRQLRADLMSEPTLAFECELFGVIPDTGMMSLMKIHLYVPLCIHLYAYECRVHSSLQNTYIK